MSCSQRVQEAREYFPRGLVQPESGYRFSLDSLLLGCFARVKPGWCGVDLGCGSGAVSFALLLNNPRMRLHLTGVELDKQAVSCAKENAALLGMGEAFQVVPEDVSAYRENEGKMDFVVINPPFRETGRGRRSHGESRRQARFETAGSLQDFIRSGTRLLKTRGRLFVVFLPERLSALLVTLARNGCSPKRMQLVHGRRNSDAKIVLVEAVKAGGEGLAVLPPLVMYDKNETVTQEAVSMCPYLACNARRTE